MRSGAGRSIPSYRSTVRSGLEIRSCLFGAGLMELEGQGLHSPSVWQNRLGISGHGTDSKLAVGRSETFFDQEADDRETIFC